MSAAQPTSSSSQNTETEQPATVPVMLMGPDGRPAGEILASGQRLAPEEGCPYDRLLTALRQIQRSTVDPDTLTIAERALTDVGEKPAQ